MLIAQNYLLLSVQSAVFSLFTRCESSRTHMLHIVTLIYREWFSFTMETGGFSLSYHTHSAYSNTTHTHMPTPPTHTCPHHPHTCPHTHAHTTHTHSHTTHTRPHHPHTQSQYSYAGPAPKFFEECETYWAPSSQANELYKQLAARKYREILREQIQYGVTLLASLTQGLN